MATIAFLLYSSRSISKDGHCRFKLGPFRLGLPIIDLPRVDTPPGPSLPASLLPQLGPGFGTVAPQFARSPEIPKLGVSGGAAGLFATSQRAFLRLQDLDETLDDSQALVDGERMEEEEAGVDDVDFAD